MVTNTKTTGVVIIEIMDSDGKDDTSNARRSNNHQRRLSSSFLSGASRFIQQSLLECMSW